MTDIAKSKIYIIELDKCYLNFGNQNLLQFLKVLITQSRIILEESLEPKRGAFRVSLEPVFVIDEVYSESHRITIHPLKIIK